MVRTCRRKRRLRRAGLPQRGQGAFLGAQRTGITRGSSAFGFMACVLGTRGCAFPWTRAQALTFKRATSYRSTEAPDGGDRRAVSFFPSGACCQHLRPRGCACGAARRAGARRATLLLLPHPPIEEPDMDRTQCLHAARRAFTLIELL